MTVRTVSRSEYYQTFANAKCVYGSESFAITIEGRATLVRYIIGYDDSQKARLGIVVGYDNGQWRAPFSAPYTEIAYNTPQKLETIYDFISELTDFLGAPLTVSLAPTYYDREMLSRLTGVFANYANRVRMDYDYYYDLTCYDTYVQTLSHASRKNLNRAISSGFEFAKTDIERAYRVIERNRREHNYYLAMTLQQVLDTAQAVDVDSFVLTLDGQDIAAAIIYRVSADIAHVIYWGDISGYGHLRPMNLLPMHIFGYYHQCGYSIIDIGTSSTNGIPNSGLCQFKESVGCLTALRPTFVF